VGGVLSKDEREIKSGQDLFASARREVVEELGVSFLQIDETVLKFGYLTEIWNVCLLFSIKLSLSKTEVLEIFRSNSDGEAADLVFLNTDNKSDLLAKFEAQDRTRLALSGII
jgi:8-oxo-dGTP pyrophosphatase MutT (NUDIX family)